MTPQRAQAQVALIGVTGPDKGGFAAWIFTRWALSRAGARAVRVTPARSIDKEALDGLVIGGGADVSHPDEADDTPPQASRKTRHALVRWPLLLLDLLLAPLVLIIRWLGGWHQRMGIDPARDKLELSLLEHARARDLPVLGICRGAQIMSVAEGGTLLRDLEKLYDERPQMHTVLARRPIEIEPDSRLHEVVAQGHLLVNSLHFHAVGEAGRDMRIVAREGSGVPQAVEHVTRSFWIGVQWHPEYLPHHRAHQALFRHLVTQAQQTRALRVSREAQQWTIQGGPDR